MSKDVKTLKFERKYIRQQITRLYNTRDDFPSFTQEKISTTIASLKRSLSSLEVLDSQIRDKELDPTSETFEHQMEEDLEQCDLYKERIDECLAALQITYSSIRSFS